MFLELYRHDLFQKSTDRFDDMVEEETRTYLKFINWVGESRCAERICAIFPYNVKLVHRETGKECWKTHSLREATIILRDFGGESTSFFDIHITHNGKVLSRFNYKGVRYHG